MADEVTLRDVYNAVNNLEAKIEKRIERIEDDVEGVKSFQNKALGILSVLFLFAGSVTNLIWRKITGEP